MSVKLRQFVYVWLLIGTVTNVAYSQLTSCSNKPCLNGGLCVVTSSNSAYCVCSGTGFEGPRCENGIFF